MNQEHKAIHHYRSKKYFYPVVIGSIFIALFSTITIYYFMTARKANDRVIADQIAQLDKIFKDINNCCKITGFRHQKDYIDFLNVAKFEGSMVGPMNLAEPHNWKGPYLKDNLTNEGREYQIIYTKKGYFILPGDNVKLSNGVSIKDLKINKDSDIESLMHDSKALRSGDKPTCC